MGNQVVYSVKVDPKELEGAKDFFARQGLALQEAVRGLIRLASHCQWCLALVESGAPIAEVQSSLASILADAKDTWRLNGVFQDTMLKVAQKCELPRGFIMNVLAEAQRIQRSGADRQQPHAE
jgi:hypothetical protein